MVQIICSANFEYQFSNGGGGNGKEHKLAKFALVSTTWKLCARSLAHLIAPREQKHINSKDAQQATQNRN